MHSVTNCFHSNQPSLSILSPRRNLSAATKHGDLTDKMPSACKSNILSLSFPISFSLPRKAPVIHSGTRSPYRNGESGSVHGVRGRIRTGSPSPNGMSESLTSNGFVTFSGFVPSGRTRVLSFFLRIRIFGFVLE
ncbi:hypothetical protein AVEN_151519-1 [Araneus ventricosus]|uniref:Uncharacterized protein n=1 Tax=Araneus ventricosus TaxID=182803 RepID=A0A4Y2IDP5_ARAVE|nr:hypothetical protein AVEN_151519-1 [Araneus ventricosus]